MRRANSKRNEEVEGVSTKEIFEERFYAKFELWTVKNMNIAWYSKALEFLDLWQFDFYSHSVVKN